MNTKAFSNLHDSLCEWMGILPKGSSSADLTSESRKDQNNLTQAQGTGLDASYTPMVDGDVCKTLDSVVCKTEPADGVVCKIEPTETTDSVQTGTAQTREGPNNTKRYGYYKIILLIKFKFKHKFKQLMHEVVGMM